MSLDVHLSYKEDGNDIEVYWANITHNLGEMADEAGLYEAMWRPTEYGYKKASDIVPVLGRGLTRLKQNPEYFKKYDAKNGWGTYENFVPFVERYLEACKKYPNADIYASV